jgi:anti-anti-sigma factor
VIYVRGELDIATTPVLGNCLSNLLDAGTPCPALVVDLSAAPFVDVSAANVLLDADRRATDRGVALSLAGCSAQFVRLLHVLHIVDVMDVIPVQRACSTVVGDCLGNSVHVGEGAGQASAGVRTPTGRRLVADAKGCLHPARVRRTVLFSDPLAYSAERLFRYMVVTTPT